LLKDAQQKVDANLESLATLAQEHLAADPQVRMELKEQQRSSHGKAAEEDDEEEEEDDDEGEKKGQEEDAGTSNSEDDASDYEIDPWQFA